MTFDIGNNLTALGLVFIFFRFVVPLLLGVIAGVIAIWIVRYLFTQYTSFEFFQLKQEWLLVGVCAFLILLIILLT